MGGTEWRREWERLVGGLEEDRKGRGEEIDRGGEDREGRGGTREG